MVTILQYVPKRHTNGGTSLLQNSWDKTMYLKMFCRTTLSFPSEGALVCLLTWLSSIFICAYLRCTSDLMSSLVPLTSFLVSLSFESVFVSSLCFSRLLDFTLLFLSSDPLFSCYKVFFLCLIGISDAHVDPLRNSSLVSPQRTSSQSNNLIFCPM